MAKCKIHKIERLRINSDGSGVRTVVFLYGCPLKCRWCCNPGTRFNGSYRELTADELYKIVAYDSIYHNASGGGVTFTGGEPLMQADFIIEFMQKYGGKVKADIETSLFADAATVNNLAPYINRWFIDFKLADKDEHKLFTGVSNTVIKSNIANLAEKTDKITLTYPIITGINDSYKNAGMMIDFMQKYGLKQVELHPYRKSCEKQYENLAIPYQPIDELPNSTLEALANMFEANGIEIRKADKIIGKDKCRYLKNIRKEYCTKNGIDMEFEECTFEGKCIGTCPKCEQDLSYINKAKN